MSAPPERCLDDFLVGECFTSPGLTLTESMMVDFALTYDPQPFHLDELAASEYNRRQDECDAGQEQGSGQRHGHR